MGALDLNPRVAAIERQGERRHREKRRMER